MIRNFLTIVLLAVLEQVDKGIEFFATDSGIGNDSVGFDFADLPGIKCGGDALFSIPYTQSYWNEEASICVSPEGMWQVEQAAFECHSMCLEAVADVVQSDELLRKFA